MGNLLKFLPLLLKGKDIFDAFEDEHDKKKPFYLSRRFIASVFGLISAGLAINSGITIDPKDLDIVVSDTMTFVDKTEALLAAGSGLYATYLGTVGTVGAVKRKKK